MLVVHLACISGTADWNQEKLNYLPNFFIMDKELLLRSLLYKDQKLSVPIFSVATWFLRGSTTNFLGIERLSSGSTKFVFKGYNPCCSLPMAL